MPSGRDIHLPKPFVPPSLDEVALNEMRSAPTRDDTHSFSEGDDDSDEEDDRKDEIPPGAFPGASFVDSHDSSYY